MDEGKRQQMREEAAERNGISKRTLYRYEKGYREEGFEGLRPAGRTKRRRQGLPENFERIMEQAVQLKREVPKRSVRQIIKDTGAGRMGTAGGFKAVHDAEAPVRCGSWEEADEALCREEGNIIKTFLQTAPDGALQGT